MYKFIKCISLIALSYLAVIVIKDRYIQHIIAGIVMPQFYNGINYIVTVKLLKGESFFKIPGYINYSLFCLAWEIYQGIAVRDYIQFDQLFTDAIGIFLSFIIYDSVLKGQKINR